MKQLVAIILVTLFAVFAIADIVRDFITNDPVNYFTKQPDQLFVVAAIAITGGLVAFVFHRLSPHWQRKAKLITLGVTAAFVTLTGGYFSFWLAGLPHQFDRAIPQRMLWTVALGTTAVAGLLWFEFYQVLKKRVE